MKEAKTQILSAVESFGTGNLFEHSTAFFNALGYNTTRQNRLSGNTYPDFKDSFIDEDDNFNEEKSLSKEWKTVELLFQITNEEVSGKGDIFSTDQVDDTIIESYLFFAIELKGDNYSRTKLAQITREVNKLFSMPALILFKYSDKLTLSIINRRLHKRDSAKDVLEKVTLIKDIRTTNPHRAHIEILSDLSLPEIMDGFDVKNFVELHRAWQKVLDTSELNKRFFKELSNWYFWAINEVEFPNDEEKDRDKRNPISVIRLLTRFIFVWFIKEKGLIPDKLFEKKEMDKLLNYDDVTDSAYYKAILQNLFFATLNTEMNRDKKGSRRFINGQFLVHYFYRYAKLFKDKEKAIKLFEDVPFLNGGLFDCLDRKGPDGKSIRIDCFSENPKHQKRLTVPDYLFFGEEQTVDLSEVYDDKRKNKETVRPLITILNSYKFTIAENTPIEEEVALDPELLGKVFENLLASYNPETKTTARKQTGSFYTPREIVNYMVDESLIAYLQNHLPNIKNAEKKLRQLFEYNEQPHEFDKTLVDILINAIDNCKILDPACGSGAFPMGILHRLVFLLHKLDPHNKQWKQKQLDKAMNIDDADARENLLEDIEDSFDNNEMDYGRKLFLIENCIYGVDIQPIAGQIAKLRFFISLIVDQRVDPGRKNLGIRPLPNLETRFVAANTLIGIDKPAQMTLRNPAIDSKEGELHQVRERHFTARTPKTKEKYRELDEQLRQELAELLEADGFKPETTQMLANWNPYDQNASAPFFDPEWMFGIKEGFDVVIGNPPYVEHKKLKFIASVLKDSYETFSGTADLYVYFYEQGIKCLKQQGILSFITSNKFIRTKYGLPLRTFFLEYHIQQIIDFTDIHVFDALVASCVLNVINEEPDNNNKVLFASCDDSIEHVGLQTFINGNSIKILQQTLSPELWLLENSENALLKSTIEGNGKRLKEIIGVNVNRGVTTGYNPAFLIDDTERKALIKQDNNSKDVIMPLIQGRNIKKWIYSFTNNYLIFTKQGINIKSYPALKTHLQKFYDELRPRTGDEKKGRKPGSYKWFEIQDNTAYYQHFEREKIVWGLTSDRWTFAYDNDNNYLPSNGYILTSTKVPVKYILAILNSSLMKFYFGFIGIMTAGGAYTLKHGTILEFPIPDKTNYKPFIRLVNQILTAKQNNPKADTTALENEIDLLVYKLYGLSYVEVKVIDPEIESIISEKGYNKRPAIAALPAK